MLDVILSQVATGLVLGGLYVLIAIGLSIIFGLLGIVNFAHGNFFALGAYFALTLQQSFGWPAVILAPIATGIVGMIVEATLILRRPGLAPVAEGLAERQAAKEEDVEEAGGVENEKKAARLQAEAESEAGRGRGEKVRGTTQPKRRIPNSGPRRGPGGGSR